MIGGGGNEMCGVSPRGDFARGSDWDCMVGEPLDRVCGIGVPGLFPRVAVDEDADDDGDDLHKKKSKAR